MKAISIVFAAATLLSSCQTTEKAAPVATEATPSVNADNWQKSKECAAQAEKTRGKDNSSDDLEEGSVNHYSPKYNRCFVKITHTMRRVKVGPGVDRTSSTMLIDAFEGSVGAMVSFTGRCYLGGEPADCAKAEDFISDAMTH